MPRAKRAVVAHAKHKKVRAKAKGYYGARKNFGQSQIRSPRPGLPSRRY